MDKSIELLKSIGAKLSVPQFPDENNLYAKEKDCLAMIENELENTPDDLLLTAIKSELIQSIDTELSTKLARIVLSVTVDDDSEKAKFARGIALYVCALEADRRQEYQDKDDTLNMFRLALENYPAHWNAASMFADHAYNDDKFYDEAISHLEKAIQGNTDKNIILGFLNQAAFISHHSNHDQNAVKYYEESAKIQELDENRLSRLGLSYGRTKQFAKAFAAFRLSRQKEIEYVVEQRKTNPYYRLVNRGIEHPKLEKITSEFIDEYEKNPTPENLIAVSRCFFYHPAALARFVFDFVHKELTGRNEINKIAYVFGIETSQPIDQGQLMSENTFNEMVKIADEKINIRLKDTTA